LNAFPTPSSEYCDGEAETQKPWKGEPDSETGESSAAARGRLSVWTRDGTNFGSAQEWHGTHASERVAGVAAGCAAAGAPSEWESESTGIRQISWLHKGLRLVRELPVLSENTNAGRICRRNTAGVRVDPRVQLEGSEAETVTD
jgi:hypothetical protein